MASGLAAAMWRQAEHDLGHAERSLGAGDFDWAAYAAQQSGEKALKAVLLAGGDAPERTRDLTKLFKALVAGGYATDEERDALEEVLSDLTVIFVVARCPSSPLDAAPADLVSRPQAERALAGARRVLDFARSRGVGEGGG